MINKCPCVCVAPQNKFVTHVSLDQSIKNAFQRTFCIQCSQKATNVIPLASFYSIIKSLPDQQLYEQLGYLQNEYQKTKALINSIIDSIFRILKNYSDKLEGLGNELKDFLQLLTSDKSRMKVERLQQMAHDISTDKLGDYLKKIKQLPNERRLMYIDLSRYLEQSNMIVKNIISEFHIEFTERAEWLMQSHPVKQQVYCLEFNSNGSQIFSGGTQYKVDEEDSFGMILQIQSQQLVESVYGAHSRPIHGVICTNYGSIITFSEDQTIREGILNSQGRYEWACYKYVESKISAICLSGIEDMLLTGDNNGKISIWKRAIDNNVTSRWIMEDAKLVHDEAPIIFLQINRAQTFIYSGTGNNQLIIWDFGRTQWKIRQIIHNTKSILYICLQDEVNLITATAEGQINCYRGERAWIYEKIHGFRVHSRVRQLLYNQQKEQLIVLSPEGFRVIQKIDSQFYQEIYFQQGNYQLVAISKNGELIAAQGDNQIDLFQRN